MLCIIASGVYFTSNGGGQVYVKNLARALHAQQYLAAWFPITQPFRKKVSAWLNTPMAT